METFGRLPLPSPHGILTLILKHTINPFQLERLNLCAKRDLEADFLSLFLEASFIFFPGIDCESDITPQGALIWC